MRARGAFDGVALAALAFAVYAAAGRSGFHGIDAHYLLGRAHVGGLAHPYHTFYLPALAAVRALVAPFGGTLFDAAIGLSAAGASVGVLCAHGASRIAGMDRGAAAFAALLLASLPAVAFFATVVEVHGLALGFAGVAWLAIAWWSRAPGPRRAAVVGVALVLAFLAHPSAAPLGGSMAVALALGPRGRFWPTLLRDGAVALAVLVAGIVAVPAVLRAAGGASDAGFALGYLTVEAGRHATVPHLAKAVWQEWLLGMLPTGFVLAWLASTRSRVRRAAWAALCATVPFVVVGWLMLEDHESEYGAYTSAIAWPTVAVVAVGVRGLLPRGLLIACAVVASALVASRCGEDPRSKATAEAVTAAVGERPFYWLVGDRHDVEAWLVHHGAAPVLVLADLLGGDAAAVASVLPLLDAEVARRRAAGEVVVVTDNAFRLLAEVGATGGAAEPLRQWLLARGARPGADDRVNCALLGGDLPAGGRGALSGR